MKTLTDLVLEKYRNSLSSTPYFISANDYLEIINSSFDQKQFNGFQSIEDMSNSVKSLQQLLVLFESAEKDLATVNKNLGTLNNIKFIAVVDIYKTIKEQGEGVNISKLKLKGAQLKGAQLSGANLTGTDLSGSDLEKSDLTKADFSEANLEGANLSYAKLNGANMKLADLRRVNLKYSDVRSTKWEKTALRGTELWGAYLWKVDLSDAFTNGLDLSRADLRGN